MSRRRRIADKWHTFSGERITKEGWASADKARKIGKEMAASTGNDVSWWIRTAEGRNILVGTFKPSGLFVDTYGQEYTFHT